MNQTLYLKKILPLCCGVALLASCSSKSSSPSNTTVVMPNVSTNTASTVTPVAPVTPVQPATVTPVTPSDTSGGHEVTEDAVSEATVSVEQNEIVMNIGLQTGASAVGAARMMRDNEEATTANIYNMEILLDEAAVLDYIAEESNHVASVRVDMAAQHYSAHEDIAVLAVTSYSDFHLLEKGETIQSISDLAGKTIWASGGGTLYEVVLTQALEEAGLTIGTDVFVEYMSAEDVRAKMLWNDVGYGALSVPDCTKLMVEEVAIRSVSILGEEIPMHCVVVKQEFLEENENQVSHFLLDYQISLAYMQGGAEDVGDMVMGMGVATNPVGANMAVAQSNLVCLTGTAMKSALQLYYSDLFETNPDLVGGALPYDDFYYGA